MNEVGDRDNIQDNQSENNQPVNNPSANNQSENNQPVNNPSANNQPENNQSENNQLEANRRTRKETFLFPQSRYRGDFTPEKLAFNSNLQEFAQKTSIICNLETNGKIAPEDAYRQIKALWKELKQSKKKLLDH